MNKKSLTLLFAAALCGVHLSFAHEIDTAEVVVTSEKTIEATDACCAEAMPAQEVAIKTAEASLTEQELPELTEEEEQELEKLITELIKAQQEQEAALVAQEQE